MNKIIIIGMLACLCFETINGVPLERKKREAEPETTILNRIDGDSSEPKIVDIESLFNQNNEYDAYDVMATESSDGNEASENSDGNEASENPDGNAASENSDDN